MSRPPTPPPTPGDAQWGAPSGRRRALTAGLALVLAGVTFAVVNHEWRRAAPPPPPPPTSVEAKLVATPAPPPPPPAR